MKGPAPKPGWLKGLSDNYLRVILPGPREWHNHLISVRFRELQGEALVGEVIQSP